MGNDIPYTEEHRPYTFDETTKPYRGTFISYAHEDVALARPLARLLRESNVPVWFDEWKLRPNLRGVKLFRALYVAVARADAMIVLDSETFRGRSAQKVPGSSLAYATAPLESPINNAPIPGRERNLWVQNRSPERMLFKEIYLRVAEGHTDSVRQRRAVYFESVVSFGYPGRTVITADWEECHVPDSPNYGTLIGQEVYLEGRSLENALPLLVDELRTPQEPLARQQQNRYHVMLEVNKAHQYSPNRYELIGFGPFSDAETERPSRSRPSRYWRRHR